jgi:hypothetical protein
MAKALTKVKASIGFAKELVTQELVTELRPLLIKHYHEISYFQTVPLNPDFELYKTLDKSNLLRLFTARDCERIIGYNTFIVTKSPHYQDALQACQDLLFLDPYYRGSGFGEDFIEYVDSELKTEGVQFIMRHVTEKNDYSQLLGWQDYKMIGREYLKCLI